MFDRSIAIVNATGGTVRPFDLRRPGGNVALEAELVTDAIIAILEGSITDFATAREIAPDDQLLTAPVLCVGVTFTAVNFRIPDNTSSLTFLFLNGANVNLRIHEIHA